ncbi:MAG: hypothetical protein ACRC46_02830 [Thermoguttaceae bacterium]
MGRVKYVWIENVIETVEVTVHQQHKEISNDQEKYKFESSPIFGGDNV